MRGVGVGIVGMVGLLGRSRILDGFLEWMGERTGRRRQHQQAR